MAWSATLHDLPVLLTAVLLCQFLISGLLLIRADPVKDSPNNSSSSTVTGTEADAVVNQTNVTTTTMAPTIPTTLHPNDTDVPGSVATIHPANTTAPIGEYHYYGEISNTVLSSPTPAAVVHRLSPVSVSNSSSTHPLLTRLSPPGKAASYPLTTGEIIGISIGVVCGVAGIVVLICCLRNKNGYKKAASVPVTYRRGANIKHDRAPLTTKDKDPSPPPATHEDQFFGDDDPNRRLRMPPIGDTRNARRDERASLDGDVPPSRDGGDDDYFYDEIFGKSAFTDEQTSASIKELSSSTKPEDDEWPDLIFDDEFALDDPFR